MSPTQFTIVLAAILGSFSFALTASAVMYIKQRVFEIKRILGQVAESLTAIAESKRLSTILTIEAKKGLDIKPEEFEPKKEELRKSMHSVLEEKVESYKKKDGRIDQPDTVAFVILNHSGFDQFVEYDVKKKAQGALARLIANQDLSAAKRFLTTLARNL